MSLPARISQWLGWRTVHLRGAYEYQENRFTGARRARRWTPIGHAPLVRTWLDGGDWPDQVRTTPAAPIRTAPADPIRARWDRRHPACSSPPAAPASLHAARIAAPEPAPPNRRRFAFLTRLFAWETIRITGAIRYQENAITGHRRILVSRAGGYHAVDTEWLNGGPWSQHPWDRRRPACFSEPTPFRTTPGDTTP